MKDLQKIYLIKKNLAGGATFGVTNPMVEAFLGKMFVHIGETYRGGRLDNSMPVFKFGARKLTRRLLDRDLVSSRNLYSPLDKASNASNKRSLYRFLRGDYMPSSCFSDTDASSMRFPIVVKPEAGWGGQGVRIISKASDLPTDDGLVFQEHLNIEREYRFTMVKSKLIFVARRLPNNDKAQAIYAGEQLDHEAASERNKFIWRKRELAALEPYGWFREAKRIATDVMARTELGVAGLDIAVMPDRSVKLIECNTSLGMTHNQSVLLYESIFEDWYGRPVDQDTKKTLDLFGEILQDARKLYVRSNYPTD